MNSQEQLKAEMRKTARLQQELAAERALVRRLRDGLWHHPECRGWGAFGVFVAEKCNCDTRKELDMTPAEALRLEQEQEEKGE